MTGNDAVSVGASCKRAPGAGRRRYAWRYRNDGIAPADRSREGVAAENQVGRDEARNARIGAANLKHLTARLEVVVLETVRAGTVGACDRLRILAHGFDVADVAVDDRRVATVQGDATLLANQAVPMNVDPVDDQALRDE